MPASSTELLALCDAVWPGDDAIAKGTRALVQLLLEQRTGPKGPYSLRTSVAGHELNMRDPHMWGALPDKERIRTLIANAVPHVKVVDDPTCTNPLRAGLKLDVKSLQTCSRPQVTQLSQLSSDDDGEALHTPEMLTPNQSYSQLSEEGSSTTQAGAECSSSAGGGASVLTFDNVDARVFALVAYPPQHRAPGQGSLDDCVTRLRCFTTCFLLSRECIKGPAGPHSTTCARLSNVLRTGCGATFGAVGGKGGCSRPQLIADNKVLSLTPSQSSEMCMRLDVAGLQRRALRAVTKMTPIASSAVETASVSSVPPPIPAATHSAGSMASAQQNAPLPYRKEVESALGPLAQAAFPGSDPLNKLRREAVLLIMQYCLAVYDAELPHMQAGNRGQESPQEPAPDEPALTEAELAEGWQLPTKKKPTTSKRNSALPSPTGVTSGFGAMPCSILGTLLNASMPQAYHSVPVANGGKHLKNIYNDVPCILRMTGPRKSEVYLKLDVPLLATMGCMNAGPAVHALNAIHSTEWQQQRQQHSQPLQQLGPADESTQMEPQLPFAWHDTQPDYPVPNPVTSAPPFTRGLVDGSAMASHAAAFLPEGYGAPAETTGGGEETAEDDLLSLLLEA